MAKPYQGVKFEESLPRVRLAAVRKVEKQLGANKARWASRAAFACPSK